MGPHYPCTSISHHPAVANSHTSLLSILKANSFTITNLCTAFSSIPLDKDSQYLCLYLERKDVLPISSQL